MRVALVELRESHEECLYTQLAFLKSAGYQVSLILHAQLEAQMSTYQNLADAVYYVKFNNQSALKKIKLQFQIFKKLKTFHTIIFNTAHSYSVIRNLSLLLRFSPTQCIGVLHDASKLTQSATQRIISKKIKKYFVLSDALVPKNQSTNQIKLQSFYPIYFPDYGIVSLKKTKGEIWIGIPGRIDYKRRNYDFLVAALSRMVISKQITFLILGKTDRSSDQGKRFYTSIQKTSNHDRVKFFDTFIDNDKYHAYLKACDCIMPLLKKSPDYIQHKISGSFNLAFAHKKPLLCHIYFKTLPDIRQNALFYTEDSLERVLQDIAQRKAVWPTNYSEHKWAYSIQQKRYIDFINL